MLNDMHPVRLKTINTKTEIIFALRFMVASTNENTACRGKSM